VNENEEELYKGYRREELEYAARHSCDDNSSNQPKDNREDFCIFSSGDELDQRYEK
jgi:hypothetical protein